MHASGRSPSGSTTEPPPDAPQGPADGWDIARGRGGCDVRSPQGFFCHAARCLLVRVPLRGARSILRPVSVPCSSRAPAAGLRTFPAAAPHLCPPPPPAAASLAGCLERIRASAFHRRVVSVPFPDGETARVPRQPVTAGVPCKILSNSSVNCLLPLPGLSPICYYLNVILSISEATLPTLDHLQSS